MNLTVNLGQRFGYHSISDQLGKKQNKIESEFATDI